ncbi:hypothetical protein B0H13DRAFT_2329084 [Mycena leptocephala]|nr:hypothetical protein B0H13DRAFT_2329084 [Mycena leptocephala]
MDVDNQPLEPQRAQELWFEDGNIVIQAGNSLYCVFRGILATHSSVFKDMLSFPQPPDSELMEGCPLVGLPDSDREVTPFLKALFDPDFFMPFPAPTDFDTVVGCLRLSHKYGVDFLRRRALIHFSSAFPTTLSQLDLHVSRPMEILSSSSWEIPESEAYILRAIQVAREVDTPWVLPRAFYILCAEFETLSAAIFHGADYMGVPTSLSLQDRDSFLKGHEIQISGKTADILQFLSYPPNIEGCATPLKCGITRLTAIGTITLRGTICSFSRLPLHVWTTEDWELLQDMCATCLTALKRTHQDTRQAFWDELPETYGLPPWEELERLKAAAIGTNIFS